MSVRVIRSIVDTMAPQRVRGDWDHYPCPFCGDTSAHLGVNRNTGAVKCLRCGASASLNADTTIPETKPLEKLKKEDVFVWHATGDWNEAVEYYMVSGRNCKPGTGWAYGCHNQVGCVVFPCYSVNNKFVFWQSRYIHDKRYNSCKENKPVMDCWPAFNDYPTETLILVEGPIDAHRIRALTGLWCSPTYGITPSKQYMASVLQAVYYFGIKVVKVLFDGEDTAYAASKSIARRLKRLDTMGNTTYKACEWEDYDDQDPGSASPQEITYALTR